ncbi:MAG: SufE family protein [Alphaproteobacteria bacterium]|nr:SufE family protein [Alphaproteobacteria bacterium]
MTYDEIKNILSAVDDPVVRLEMVMDLGKQLSPVPDGAVCSEITGCASHVEICRAGNRFYGMADSDLVRGIVAIMVAIVDGKTPDEIKKIDIMKLFSDLNINLGAGRLNGVNSMIRFLHNL